MDYRDPRDPRDQDPVERDRQLIEEPLRKRDPSGAEKGPPFGSESGSPFGSTDYARENWRSEEPREYDERTGGRFEEGFGSGRTGGRFGFTDSTREAGGETSADDASSRYGGFRRTTTSGRFAGRGPKGYRRSDETIREDVCERLEENGDVDATEIEVRVENGEVTLDGKVDSREARRLAEDLIEFTPGVRHVNNQLRVEKGFFARIFGGGGSEGSDPDTR